MFVKRGNVLLIVLVALAVVSLLVGGYFWWSSKPVMPVGAPAGVKNSLLPTLTPKNENLTPEEAKKTPPLSDPTVNWKTYTNNIDSYQVKLPETWDWSVRGYRSQNEVFINSKEPDPKIPGIRKYQLIIDTRKLFPEETYDDAVVSYNQVGAQEFNPGGPKPPISIVKKSTSFLKEYYFVVLANSQRSAAIPIVDKRSLILIHVLNWPEKQDYLLFDLILSTFKFLDNQTARDTASKTKKYSYTIPPNWQAYNGSLGGIKIKFSYPNETTARYVFSTSEDNRSIVVIRGVQFLDISLPAYYGWTEYKNGSRREWFLENAKTNSTEQNITFAPIDFQNGNSFYQAKATKINNLFGVISNENPINLYFGVVGGKMLIIRDWKVLSQDDIYKMMQSIKFSIDGG